MPATKRRRRRVLAIVGRPNTGKSTLFNRLTGRRRALVDRRPGITRDRLYGEVEWRGRTFTLIDTGGLEPGSDDPLLAGMGRQVEFALREADAVLFLVDAREGLLPADLEIARRLREAGAEVFLGVNKVETGELERAAQEFHRLGFVRLFAISGEESRGLDDLLDAVLERFGERAGAPAAAEEEEPQRVRIAVVGRPNVGKSSLVNRLLGEERVVVHDVPGTTRDSVDSILTVGDREYVLVDTAGIRKRSGVKDRIEYASSTRAADTIHDADVAVLVVDAGVGFTQLDVQIAGETDRAGAGLVIVLNKWDLVTEKEEAYKAFVRQARERLHFAGHAPILTLSARTGERVRRVLPLVDRVAENRRRRVPTAELNRFLQELLSTTQPPAVRGKEFRPKYLTEVSVAPPTFLVFTGKSLKPPPGFARYLEKRLREVFDFEGTPLRTRFRTREPRHAVAPGTPARRGRNAADRAKRAGFERRRRSGAKPEND